MGSTGSSSPPNWCFFGWLLGLTQLLLHGALGLVLFWVFQYLGGVGWRDQPKLEFNYHPILMIGGFIYLSGNGTHINIPLEIYIYPTENVCVFIQLYCPTVRLGAAVKFTKNSSTRLVSKIFPIITCIYPFLCSYLSLKIKMSRCSTFWLYRRSSWVS